MDGARSGPAGDRPVVPSGSGDFEIRVRGRVGERFRSAFGELTVRLRPAETVLYGVGLDQPALYGILDRIQALGLELLEVRRLP
ncbi:MULTISPECIES: hypothetical protein [Streptomyces]|uniref:Uncharacterized protein n=2 Tax=Streptomyces TaxID=1883 RepID=A0A0W7X6R9_9ACTN|nr:MULTISPECIES: hypothetical protein [Streptomyces]KUF18259.1 hypothetical protein AT728_25170 [Streptomyces silvensis]MVO88142.1 hypothetical protein [Streptomyces typhae]